jgi:hypothetical protein
MKRQLKHHPYLNITQDSIKVPQDKYKSDQTVEIYFLETFIPQSRSFSIGMKAKVEQL